MSAKTIGFPSNPSLDQEYQGWVWDGEKWVSDAVKGGLWEESGDDIYYSDGNVGIGAAPDSSGDKLQVEGNATFTGGVTAGGLFGGSVVITNSVVGAQIELNDSSNGNTTGRKFLRSIGNTFDIVNNDYSQAIFILDDDGNATFTGTVDAAGFTVNGQPISGGGGGLPDGDYTHNGIITATDFVASSDERLKDNITTAPVGLIDSLKGREWDWKESGEKGSGVVAQELEQVLPHLVSTDDEGMKSVSYMGLCAYLIEELKDCRERLAVLEAKQ